MAATAAEQVAALINKKLGEDMVILGSRLLDEAPVSFLSTGSLALDVMYGGGLVRNQWNEIVGLESSGKTATLLKMIAHQQRRDKDFLAVWVAAEDLDPTWCGVLGVDMRRMLVVPSNMMEEAYGACIEVAQNQAADMIVIDSLPALSPMAEIEKDMDEFTVGRGALLTGQFLRKATAAMKRIGGGRPVTGVIINQWRDRIGVTRGDPRTTPGGKAKNYFFWTRSELSRIEWIVRNKQRIGITSKVHTFKNKAAPNQRECELDFYFDEGGPVPAGSFDTTKETVNVALAYEIIERSGNRYDFLGEKLCNSRDSLYEMMYEDPTLPEKIYEAVMHKVRGDEAPPEAPRRGVKRRQR